MEYCFETSVYIERKNKKKLICKPLFSRYIYGMCFPLVAVRLSIHIYNNTLMSTSTSCMAAE